MNEPVPSAADGHRSKRGPFTVQFFEVLILAATLLATVIISALTLHQTTRHFEIERTSAFVARFNGPDMVSLREQVNRWLKSGETPAALYARENSADPKAASEASETIARLMTIANFFEEFGSAIEVGSLDEHYAHVLLGGLCIQFGRSLEPFIKEARIQRQRPQLFEEVFFLRDRMLELENREKAGAG